MLQEARPLFEHPDGKQEANQGGVQGLPVLNGQLSPRRLLCAQLEEWKFILGEEHFQHPASLLYCPPSIRTARLQGMSNK